MRQFRAALNFCQLKEIHLQNRKYIWSNERRHPTMVRLDRVFCNEAWDLAFERYGLQALATSISDHCPLLLSTTDGPRLPRPFRFENFWTKLPGFLEEVQQVWRMPTPYTQPVSILHYKMAATAKHLRARSRSLMSENSLKLHMAMDVIHRLDSAQETRHLSDAEFRLRGGLKKRVLGYAVIERTRKKQQSSRVNSLKEGDTNTKFFHLKANGRRRRNYIQRLQHEGGWATSHMDKASVAQMHFDVVMSTPGPPGWDFDWNAINIQSFDLSHLDAQFTEEEVLAAILQMPPDKAPGPDGFTGSFFRTCWQIVKGDIMTTISTLHDLRWLNFDLLNTANIILLPKKAGSDRITDYRPISLIHSVAKLFTKILAIRLAPAMRDIISKSQSAFIKGRSIHDNFMYVRGMARRFHRNKTPCALSSLTSLRPST